MVAATQSLDRVPVISSLEEFDQSSGSLVERLIFNNRLVVILLCVLTTALLGMSIRAPFSLSPS